MRIFLPSPKPGQRSSHFIWQHTTIESKDSKIFTASVEIHIIEDMWVSQPIMMFLSTGEENAPNIFSLHESINDPISDY
jgi:hypothetical protein